MIRSFSTLLWAALAATMLLLVPATSRAADLTRALDYVPHDAQVVVALDGDDLKASPIFKRLFPAFLTSEPSARRELNELKRKTGFDPLRDVRGAVLAFGQDFPDDEDNFVLVVDARVSEQRVVQFMRAEGAKFEVENDRLGRWYSLGGGDGALAFRGQHVILASAKLFPKAMQKKGPPPALAGDLKLALQREALVVVAQPNPSLQKGLARELPEAGQARSLLATLGFPGGGLELKAKIGFLSSSTPSKLAAQINQQLTQIANEPELQKMGLASIVRKISVKARGQDLVGEVNLPKTEVDQLLDLVERFL